MRFIDKFVRRIEGKLHKKPGDQPLKEIDALRQSSPLDERDAEIAECESAETAETVSSGKPAEQRKRAAGR